jgi:hypothetical protein
MEDVIKDHQVDNMKEFCRRIDYLPQNMTQLRQGIREVNLEMIIRLFQEFRGNPVYVLLGFGKRVLEENEMPAITKNLVSLSADSDAKLIRRLEDLLESKNEIISLLKLEVERLKSESRGSGKKIN